ncbi:MAG TPA: hypothetical protein VGB56_00795 [Flavisolibacter sp.]|jgi:hypothetical protein
MRLRNINIVTAIALGAVMAFTGCSKDDGAIPKNIGIEDVPAVTTNIDATGSQAIDLLNISSFQGKFKVDLYFPGTTPPNKVDVVVRKNGSAANVKLFKADIAAFPSVFTITAAEIATLFGAPIALGDTYDFAPSLYVGSKKYDAFPGTGNGTGAGVNGMPGFGEFARFAAICKFDPALYQGNFVVVSDAWEDFQPGDVVAFTKVSDNSFSFVTPAARNPVPVVVTINTANNVATITRQVVGSSWAWAAAATYPQPTISATGNVTPCDKKVTLGVQYGFGGGTSQFSGGPYSLVLQKQ